MSVIIVNKHPHQLLTIYDPPGIHSASYFLSPDVKNSITADDCERYGGLLINYQN